MPAGSAECSVTASSVFADRWPEALVVIGLAWDMDLLYRGPITVARRFRPVES
jgi:hypothetical protein